MIGKAIYSKLYGTANISAIVGNRIYPDMATQDATYPFIVYTVDGTDPTDVKDSVSPLDIVNVSIAMYADTYSVVTDLAEKIRTALDRMTGTFEGMVIQGCRFSGQSSGDMHLDKHIFVIEQEYRFRQNR